VGALSIVLAAPLGSSPPTAAQPVASTSVRVLAVNVRSFPAMSHHAYAADMRTVFGTSADALLGAEIIPRTGELALWRARARATGRRVVEPGFEDTQALDRATLAVRDSRAIFLHRAPGGPASPARWAVQSRTQVAGFHVAFLALHLTNGCLPQYRRFAWYAGRCVALRAEIARVRVAIHGLHMQGYTTVVGGDLNRGPIRWARTAVSLGSSTLMHLSAVPAADVRLEVSHRRVIRTRSRGGVLYTDHNAVLGTLTLTRR
jgi:hypothetical protein